MLESSLFPWVAPNQSASETLLSALVADPAFPCVGAKAALARGTLRRSPVAT